MSLSSTMVRECQSASVSTGIKEGIATQEGDQKKMARVFQSVRKISEDGWSEVGFLDVEMRFQKSPMYYFSALEGI